MSQNKKFSWRNIHKYVGLVFSFFLLMFCLSGIILNHRPQVADVNISRRLLPHDYQFQHWNNGLLKGTVSVSQPDSSRAVLLYGAGGLWLTTDGGHTFTDCNAGLPAGADYRNIRNVVQMPDGSVFAAGMFGLYQWQKEGWQTVPFSAETLRLSDLTRRGDTLVVVGRSQLFAATAPYRSFQPITLPAASDYTGKVTLFRTMWLIHSGEILGLPGKLLMDAVAVALSFLIVTGWLYWLLRHRIKWMQRRHRPTLSAAQHLKWNFKWHDFVGRKTIVLTLFIALTGWCLRPPLLIPLALTKTPPIPGSALDSPNPWHDKLRALRYDTLVGDWLLSTSEGFYSLSHLGSTPTPLSVVPPVSVMGLTVLEAQPDGAWLAGSFSGMYVWQRTTGSVTDFFTGEPVKEQHGAPIGRRAVSGYTAHFAAPAAVEYGSGTSVVPQPEAMRALPMSLWALSLEVHVGRIYTLLGFWTSFFVFFAGLLALLVLWSGWKIRCKHHA